MEKLTPDLSEVGYFGCTTLVGISPVFRIELDDIKNFKKTMTDLEKVYEVFIDGFSGALGGIVG